MVTAKVSLRREDGLRRRQSLKSFSTLVDTGSYIGPLAYTRLVYPIAEASTFTASWATHAGFRDG
jgi:hypothetical protein